MFEVLGSGVDLSACSVDGGIGVGRYAQWEVSINSARNVAPVKPTIRWSSLFSSDTFTASIPYDYNTKLDRIRATAVRCFT